MNYKHITINKMWYIANFLDLWWSIRKIVKYLNRNASTISRKIRRNSVNGKYLAHITNEIYLHVYFEDPYVSWQRGTNKNTNGLLREFYPKKFDFSTITQNELDVVVNIINNRPRKCLGYKTPTEVLAET